jgi:hypothetical protein
MLYSRYPKEATLPAKDTYHDTVVRALEKDGWRITAQQVRLTVSRRKLWVDIEATRQDLTLTILIEVKGLDAHASKIEALASAAGKYLVYNAILEWAEDERILYLAVPQTAYDGILNEQIGLIVRQKAELKLIVFDPLEERIIEWIR